MTIRPRRISTMKEGTDKEKEPSPLRDVLIHERHELQTWKETVEIRPPNLLVPRQIASHVNAQPLCKLAVSPKCDTLAVMSHRRIFQIFRVTEEEIVAESSVQILEDASAEYCIFEFSASGTLLLSTRSDASIDVFDRLAEHCYTIMPPVPESSPDLISAISSLSSYSLMATEEKFSDYMTALHYNCTLSGYKMGRTSYFKMFTVLLESPLTGVCQLLPAHGMTLVTTHYRIGAEDVPGGLASYRMIKSSPYVVSVVAPKYEKDWWESLSIRLPFASSFAYISSLSVDATESRAVGVSTTGDVFLFSLPSLSLLSSLSHVSRVARPRAAVFVHGDEMGVLFSSGRLIRCPTTNPQLLMQTIAEGDQRSEECYSARTQLVVPTERELFVLQSEGGPEVAISSQRSSLAARLFMLTIWRSLKQLLGMAVGDAASPLQQATQLLSLEFSLWHAPIVTLEEVLERTMRQGDFARAIQLADTHPEIEKDSVYKRQWMEVCGTGRLTKEDVKNILGRVRDVVWKAERCLQTTTPSMEVQRELVEEGILLGAPLSLHVRLAHHGRVLAVMDDVEMYLEMREWPLLKVAEGLAERGSLVALERLLLSNWSSSSSSLSLHCLSVLSCLPSSIEPKRYETLVPTKGGELVVELKPNKYVDELDRVRRSGREGKREVEMVDIGVKEEEEEGEGEEKEDEEEEEEEEDERDMEKWAQSRARTIEAETGIVPYSIQLLELCKTRGCKSLEDSLTRWKHLDLFVRITRNVSASLDFLQSATVSLLGQHFAVLADSSLISSLPSIISLLEWHSPTEYEDVIKGIVASRTTNSTHLLHALLRERPEIVDGDTIVEALSSLSLSGPELIAELKKMFEVMREEKSGVKKQMERVRRALEILKEKNVHPTFGKLIASQTDGHKAREVLAQLVHCKRGEKRDEEGWRIVACDVLNLNRSLYSTLLSDEEAMEMVAERFLLDADISGEEGGRPLSISTLLTLGEEEEGDGPRLSAPRSTELLLRLADSFIASSVSGNDEQLERAKILAEGAEKGEIKSAKQTGKKERETAAAALLRSLKVIKMASDLGSGRLPIQIKHADPQTLLEECISIGDNYKEGKRCARLGQQLRVETPVAAAYAACALHAVERGDEQTLAHYIQEIASDQEKRPGAKNLPVVHTLSMRLLATPLLPQLRPTIETLAIVNAAEEELEEVLEKISSLRFELEEAMENEEKEEKERRGEGRGSEERRKESEELKRDTVPLDPYYTKAEQQEGASCSFGDWRKEEERREKGRERSHRPSHSEALSLLAAQSSSAFAAAAMLSTAREAEEKIEDERLRRYTSALRQLLPRLNGRLVEGVAPRKIIERAILTNNESTALDRLEAHGSSRERFVENAKYRVDTIEGLASMEDSSSWSDALELAAQFGIKESSVHIASLENILTTLPPSSARSLISLRGHREALERDDETIRMAGQKLRKAVLPLILEDEQYLLYLEQFHSTSIESILLHLLQYLRENCRAKDLKSLLFDESRLARAIEGVKAEDAERVGEWIRAIPGTSSACEAAARSMLGERKDPKKFLPLIRDPSMLIELLGDISVDLETDIDWLLQYPLLPVEIRSALKNHKEKMFGERNRSEERREERREESPIGGGWREESPDFGMGGGGMKMRRRGQ
ncbi:hypothetical protein PMAYCL1PPCAC_23090 [Pristionchus mayeri]|uniref:Sec39 domain-containing protein n=1 Tax=Pristionchus mayeri TaxID=1317129 RepID=A0AAN5CYP7_9BILA|nr:hypothetical protein PMAYCL1PPCAC_23090 [Pristionchus mayeri]